MERVTSLGERCSPLKVTALRASQIFYRIKRRTKGQTELGSLGWHEEFHNSGSGDETDNSPRASQIAVDVPISCPHWTSAVIGVNKMAMQDLLSS